MTTKSRLARLEAAKSDAEFFEYRHFVQTIDGEKHTYTMGVTGDVREVDAATYKAELAKYQPLAQARGVVAEIQIVYGEGGEHGNK